MSFNKKYLRVLEDVKLELEKHPENINHYVKADVLIGSKDTINYIFEFWERYSEQEKRVKQEIQSRTKF